MPAFEYKALDREGKIVKGAIEADTAKQARTALRAQKLIPTHIDEVAQKEQKQARQFSFSLFKPRISIAELALLTRQLSTLIAASLPLEEALKAVADQTEKPRLAAMIVGVRARVVEGYSLAESMADYPHIFDNLYRAMVASGEKSGHLDLVLNRLADYTEKRQKLKTKLMQAMIYPVVLTLVAIGVISVLLVSVVPEVVSQFEHLEQELPLSTQFLIGMSDFLSDYGIFIVLFLVLAFSFLGRMLQDVAFRLKFDIWVLDLPVIGNVTKSLNTSRFARTLSILSTSAVPLLESMVIAADVLMNLQVKKAVLEASDRVREGTSLYSSLQQTKLFPPMMLYMVASGEKSGELESMLERAADTQDQDFESKVNIALGVFEPMLVVSMAAIVLFIVMAILQPMIAMNNMI